MELSYAGSDLTSRQKRWVKTLEWLTRGQGLSKAHQRFIDAGECSSEDGFFRRAAAALELTYDAWFTPRAWVPANGPLLVVANHPYGVVDGLAISALLESVRPDVRIIVWNAIDLPASTRHFLPLDLSDTNGSIARRQNVSIRREATQHLRGGGCVVLFPSGSAEVTSHPLARPAEAPWTALACKLALTSRATILPIFVHGHNSRLFHAASHLGQLVRRSLFLTETRRMIGATIGLRIGEPLSHTLLQQMHAQESGCNKQLASRLRRMTLRLGKLPAPKPAPAPTSLSPTRVASASSSQPYYGPSSRLRDQTLSDSPLNPIKAWHPDQPLPSRPASSLPS